MNILKTVLLIFFAAFICRNAAAQNVLINILTEKSGVIRKGEQVFVEVSVCNTDGKDSLPAYKIRPQISFPSAIATITKTGHQLPDGWTIISNDGATIRLSNAEDMIAPNACRTIKILMEGTGIGGPSTISGHLLFSNAVAPGTVPGGPTKNDNTADNSSTSSCKVIP